MPKMALSSVDLPAPFGPMIVVIWPAGMASEMPRSTSASP